MRASSDLHASGAAAFGALATIVRALEGAADGAGVVNALVLGCTAFDDAVATVYARSDGDAGPFVASSDLLATAGAMPGDAAITSAAESACMAVAADGRRVTLPLISPSRFVSHVLDVHAATRAFDATEIAALDLAAAFAAAVIRTAELARELTARRSAVIELNGVKNDLIAMLAHDFNGPLTTIVGLADVLAEDSRFDGEGRRLLGMINASAMRLASLAKDTLAISRLDDHELSLRFDPVDLVALLRDVVRTLGVTRAIDFRAASPAGVVRADAARVRQVFENLIGNAIKFSPRGETVDVVLERVNGGVEVAIRDRGIGIPPGDMPKLFGRFARGSNAREHGIGGTGFGLYLARTIVDMHGGRITVESKVDAGSVFRVWIPDLPASRPACNRRVLLFDGEPLDRSFIAHTLRDDGFTVRHVADEAAFAAAVADGPYDIAMVGVEHVASPAALLANLPPSTARIALADAEAGDRVTNVRILRKPFLVRELRGVLRAALASQQEEARSLRASLEAGGPPPEGGG